jgi:hypothetical protein
LQFCATFHLFNAVNKKALLMEFPQRLPPLSLKYFHVTLSLSSECGLVYFGRWRRR